MGKQSNFQQGKPELQRYCIGAWTLNCFQDGGDIGDEIGEYTRESWEVSRLNH